MSSKDVECCGYRDDSDVGIGGDLNGPWTMDNVRTRALSLGKNFKPNAQIVNRLESDLASNKVIVLFTPDEVESAITAGFIPEELRDDLKNLVSTDGFNDIAVIPAETVAKKQRQALIDWFLNNDRC